MAYLFAVGHTITIKNRIANKYLKKMPHLVNFLGKTGIITKTGDMRKWTIEVTFPNGGKIVVGKKVLMA